MSLRRWEGGSGCQKQEGGIPEGGAAIWDLSELLEEEASCGSDWPMTGVSWSAGPVFLTAGFGAPILVPLSVREETKIW